MLVERPTEVRIWVEYSLSRELYFVHIKYEGEEQELTTPYGSVHEAEMMIDSLIAALLAKGFKERRTMV